MQRSFIFNLPIRCGIFQFPPRVGVWQKGKRLWEEDKSTREKGTY